MSEGDIVDIVFDLLKNNIKFFKKSELYKFYDMLDISYAGKTITTNCNNNNYNINSEECRSLKEITKFWDSYIFPNYCTSNNNVKCCDFLFYWLYGKFVKYSIKSLDINSIYDKLKTFFENKCYKDNKERFYMKRVYNKEILKGKKELYDFVEYYSTIKNFWKDESYEYKAKYCEYTKYILELYKIIEKKKCSLVYNYEMKYFEKEIIDNMNEFNFLIKECPDISNDLYIIRDNKINCLEDSKRDNGSARNKGQESVHITRIGESVIAQKTESSETALIENLLKEMYKKEDILKDFSSYGVYEEFNNENDLPNYNICETIGNSEVKGQELKKFCNKIVKNLRKVYGIQNREERNECCLYFNYWLHHQFKKILDIDIEMDSKTAYASKILGIQFPIIYKLGKHDCYYDFKSNLNDWEEIMYLLYYFKYYESTLFNVAPEIDKNKQYCNYLLKIKKLFEKNIKYCCTCYTIPSEYCDNHCPGYFKCEKHYYPIHLISKLQCNNETISESAEKLFKSVTIDQKVKLLSLKSNSVTTTTNYNNTSSMLIYNQASLDPFYFIVISGLIFIGISILFFIFYKVKLH